MNYVGGYVCPLGVQAWCFESSLTVSDWASWAQAVGTVAAILASAWFVERQHRLELRRDELRELAEEARAVAAYIDVLEGFVGIAAAAMATLDGGAVMPRAATVELKSFSETIKQTPIQATMAPAVRASWAAAQSAAEDAYLFVAGRNRHRLAGRGELLSFDDEGVLRDLDNYKQGLAMIRVSIGRLQAERAEIEAKAKIGSA